MLCTGERGRTIIGVDQVALHGVVVVAARRGAGHHGGHGSRLRVSFVWLTVCAVEWATWDALLGWLAPTGS